MNEPLFTHAALANIEETGINPREDIRLLRLNEIRPEALLADCLRGAYPDRVPGWHDYVAECVRAAGLS